MKATLAVLMLSGCALAPNTVTPSIEHRSHVLEHAPFTENGAHDAVLDAQVEARWGEPAGLFFEIGEGIALNDKWVAGSVSGYGEVAGPQEQFSAKIGYVFRIKK